MKKLMTVVALVFATAGSFSLVPVEAQAAPVLNDNRFAIETVAEGFNTATTFAFIDSSKVLVGEKDGTIRLVENGVLRPDPVYKIPKVNTFWDRGLLGLTVDSNFANNGYIYVSHTYENNATDYEGPKTARIVRYTVNRTTYKVNAASAKVLVGSVGGTPAAPSCSNYAAGSDCIPSDSPSHSAGGLRFGPDGYLYAMLGDGAGFTDVDPKAYNSQNLDWLSGKVLRINRNGVAPTSNPYYQGDGKNNRSKVFAYGLRNSYRFNFHPTTKALYAGEVGWYLSEEINLVSRGANLGWPCREGFDVHPRYSCTAQNYVNPLYAYGHDVEGESNAVTGGSFATSALYGDFNGSYFFGDYNQDFLKRAVISGNTMQVFDFGTDVGGPVDIQTGPDGMIYYLAIYTGELRRVGLRPNNLPPVASISVNQPVGAAPVAVSFSGAASTDPDGDALTYSWSFGDGQSASGVAPSHTYATDGVYTATLTVSDARGGTDTESVTVTIGAAEFPADPKHVTTTYAPNPLYLGQDVTVTTKVKNDGQAGDVLLYWEVYNQAGIRVSQQFTDPVVMQPDETKDFAFTWLPPVTGPYTVSFGIFSGDWRKTYQWVEGATTFQVLNRVPGQPNLQFVTAGGAATGTTGANLAYTVDAKNIGTAGDALVYVEFYNNATNTRVANGFVSGTYGANETKTSNFSWQPQASGSYRIAVGLFSADWTVMYGWNDAAYQITIQ